MRDPELKQLPRIEFPPSFSEGAAGKSIVKTKARSLSPHVSFEAKIATSYLISQTIALQSSNNTSPLTHTAAGVQNSFSFSLRVSSR